MPKIQPYEAGIVGDTRQNYDIKSTAGQYEGLTKLGAGIASAGEKVADLAIDFQKHKQSMDGKDSVLKEAGAEYGSVKNMAQSFNPETTDPADLTKRFREATDKHIASITDPKVQENLTSLRDRQELALQKAYYTRNGQLQAQEYKGAIDSATTTLTATAYHTPGSYSDLIKNAQTIVAELPDNLGEGKKKELFNDLQRSIGIQTANGLARDNPEELKKKLDANEFNMSGDDLDRAYRAADRSIAARDRDNDKREKQTERTQKQAQLSEFQNMHTNLSEKTFDDINGAVATGKISETQGLTLSNRLKAVADGTQKSDAAVVTAAERQLKEGKITDFEQLMQQYGHGLGQSDLRRMSKTYLAPTKEMSSDQRKMLGALSDQAAAKIIQPTQVPWGDVQGKRNYADCLNQMHSQYEQGIAKGLSPNDLLDPKSKDYVGKTIDQYARPKSTLNFNAGQAYTNAVEHSNSGVRYDPPAGVNPGMAPLSTGTQKAGAPVPSGTPAMSDKSKQAFLDDFMKSLPKGKRK